MKYTLIINSYPSFIDSHQMGQRLACAITNQQQHLEAIFFQNESVRLFDTTWISQAADSITLTQLYHAWLAIAQKHDLHLQLCSQATEQLILKTKIEKPLKITGLINLAEHMQNSERILCV